MSVQAVASGSRPTRTLRTDLDGWDLMVLYHCSLANHPEHHGWRAAPSPLLFH